MLYVSTIVQGSAHVQLFSSHPEAFYFWQIDFFKSYFAQKYFKFEKNHEKLDPMAAMCKA